MRAIIERSGVSDFASTYQDIFNAIGDAADSGGQSTGDFARILINAGLAVQTVQGFLQNVANDAHATPTMAAYAQAEAAWLANYNQRTSNGTVWLVLGAAFLGVIIISGARNSAR